MKRGFLGIPGPGISSMIYEYFLDINIIYDISISWMAKRWLEKKGWEVRQAVRRSQDGSSSSGSEWRRQRERRQRVGEAQPDNFFLLLTTTTSPPPRRSTDARNTSENVVTVWSASMAGKTGQQACDKWIQPIIGEWEWIHWEKFQQRNYW